MVNGNDQPQSEKEPERGGSPHREESCNKHVSWKGASSASSSPPAPTTKEGEGITGKKEMESAEVAAETEKWTKVLVGKQFEPDLESKWGMQFKPLDESIVMPKNVRYIIDVETCDYDTERLSVHLSHDYVVQSVNFG